MPVNWAFIAFSVYLVLFTCGVAGVFIWKIKRRGGRRPVDFKLLRGPGESLRRRIAKSDEDAVLRVGGAAVVPILVTYPVLWTVAKLKPESWTTLAVGLGAVIGVFALALFFAGRWMFRDLRRYRNDSLGYLGEREVGEQLEPLLARGYRVFHDVPAKGAKTEFNLDHVAVGPTGVALIETKTLRKGNALPGRKDHVVIYDGNSLSWPWGGVNRHGLDQAGNEAEWLARFIQERTGLQIDVKPILALPGWFVETKGRGPIAVVNSKNVAREVIGSGPRILSDDQVDLIVRQLDVLCRDVVD